MDLKWLKLTEMKKFFLRFETKTTEQWSEDWAMKQQRKLELESLDSSVIDISFARSVQVMKMFVLSF